MDNYPIMKTDNKLDHLNKKLGYELAWILMDSKLGYKELKEKLPYDADDKQIYRILTPGVKMGIFEIPPTRGNRKYTLNKSLFSQTDLEKIRSRAKARIADNTTKNFDQPISHIDSPRTQSLFWNNASE